MKTITKRLYEGMFLVDSAQAAADWDGVIGAIETILKKSKVEIVSIRKWDECQLAYEIEHKRRGTYILTYFRSDGGKIGNIERDVQLSERVMRVLILKADHMCQEDIDKPTPAMVAEKRAEDSLAKAAEIAAAEEAAEKAAIVDAIETEVDAVIEQEEDEEEDEDLEGESISETE